MNRTIVLIGFVASLLSVSPPASAEDVQPAVMFSGVADNPQIRVGAAFANDSMALFFCGDAATVSTNTRWYSIPVKLEALIGRRGYLWSKGWYLEITFKPELD